MRHAAETFGHGLAVDPVEADAIVTTDMLSVAELRGFLPASLHDRPILLYCHESQFDYPSRPQSPDETSRDLHFAYTNLSSALNADAVWFNAAFHRDVFVEGAAQLASRMPDHAPHQLRDRILTHAQVQSPGILPMAARCEAGRAPGPLRLLWNARWEHDKAPEILFDALDRLIATSDGFQIDIIGERFAQAPDCFRTARERLGSHLRRLGYLERDEYERALAQADVVISTARHEFFGIAVLEAVAAGALPLTPDALAYPETLAGLYTRHVPFYDGTAPALAEAVREVSACVDDPAINEERSRAADAVRTRYGWPTRARAMDEALDHLIATRGRRA